MFVPLGMWGIDRRRGLPAIFALICGLPLLLAPAPGRAGAQSAQQPGGQITIGIDQFPDTFNPYNPYLYRFHSQLAVDRQIEASIFAPLARYDAHAHLVPDLLANIPSVRNHQVLDHGRTVILRLHPHRYWSSGTEITSTDLVFGSRVEAAASCFSSGCPLASIRATGRYTAVARLRFVPAGDILSWLPDVIPKSWRTLGGRPQSARQKLFIDPSFNYEGPGYWTSGPYQVERVTGNDEVVLRVATRAASPAPPHTTRLVYKYFPSSKDLVQAISNGTIDVATGFHGADVPALQQAATRYRIVVQPSYTLEHIEFNVGTSDYTGRATPLADVRLRQALALATDRSGLLHTVFAFKPQQRRQVAAYSPWFMTSKLAAAGADRAIAGAWDPLAQRSMPYGPRALADARQLLAAAGYAQGLDLTLIYPACGAPEQSAVATVMEQQWAQIGVRLIWHSIGCFTSLWDGFPWQSGDFETFLSGFGSWPDPRSLRPSFVPPAIPPEPGARESNWGRIDDTVLTRDWNRAGAARTTAERDTWYRRIQERVITQAYWIPLYWQPAITAVSRRVAGFGQSGSAPVWLPQQWHRLRREKM